MFSATIVHIDQQFYLNSKQTSFIMSAFFLAYCLMSILASLLVGKLGLKNILMLSLVLTAFLPMPLIGQIVCFFILLRFGSRISNSGYPSAASKAIAEHFYSDQWVFMQSAVLTTTGIGAINWRYSYFLFGTLFVVALFIIGFFIPKSQITVIFSNDAQLQIELTKVLTDSKLLFCRLSWC